MMEHTPGLLVGYLKGIPIVVSDRPEKKYMAIVRNKRVYFGQTGYYHFKDKLGYWSKFDHNDESRRKLYYSRHNKNYPEGTADYFSKRILW